MFPKISSPFLVTNLGDNLLKSTIPNEVSELTELWEICLGKLFPIPYCKVHCYKVCI